MQCPRLVFIGILALLDCNAQVPTPESLADLLSNEKTRGKAIAELSASDPLVLKTLLDLAERPSNEIRHLKLKVGLADAFGKLRAKAAIPFLIQNLGLERGWDVNTSLKSEEVILERRAAVAALVQIGAEAVPALIGAHRVMTNREDRQMAIFALSRIADPVALDYLQLEYSYMHFEGEYISRALERKNKQGK
jgi:hypothetical protein